MVQLDPVTQRSKSPGVPQHNIEQEMGGGGKVREGAKWEPSREEDPGQPVTSLVLNVAQCDNQIPSQEETKQRSYGNQMQLIT